MTAINIYDYLGKKAKGFIEDYERLVGDEFFSKERLKFFGERKSEMRILSDTRYLPTHDDEGNYVPRTAIVLSSLQRNHPDGKQRVRYYFDAKTLKRIIRR